MSQSTQSTTTGNSDGEAGISRRSTDSSGPEELIEVARGKISEGDLEGAVALLDNVLSNHPDSARAHYVLGNAYHFQGKLSEAVVAYRHAIELRSSMVEAYNDMGVALQALGELDKSILALEEAIFLDPGFESPYLNLGVSYGKADRIADSIKIYLAGLKVNPRASQLYFNLGNIYRHLGDVIASSSHFRKALEISPGYGQAYSNLGLLYIEHELLDEAVLVFEEGLSKTPENLDLLNNLGICLTKLERHDEAIEVFERMLKASPENVKAYSNLGYSLNKAGRHEDARQVLEHAIELDPSYRDALDNLLHTFSQLRAGGKELLKDSPDSLSYLFLLGHMRCGSTLLVHILNSSTEVSGFGETELTYQSEDDLESLAAVISIGFEKRAIQARYVMDKNLHDEFEIHEDVMKSPLVRAIVLVRRPDKAIPSIAKVKEVPLDDARLYYSLRLQTLKHLALASSSKEQIFFLTYEELISGDTHILDALSRWLGLDSVLNTEYRAHRYTGVAGMGDPGEMIKTGRIVKRASEINDVPDTVEYSKETKEYDDFCSFMHEKGFAHR